MWTRFTARAEQREPLVVWLPFAAGERARCLQGAMGTFTHGGRAPLAFLMHADSNVTYRGRVGKDVQRVYFFLWRDGQRSEYVAEALLVDGGKFELEVRIPPGSRGPRWYRITTQDASGRLADVATLPVLVQ